MTAAIRRAGVTNTIVRINVSRTGKATLIGRIPRGTRNPLVEVNFADNRLSGTSGSYVNAYYTTGARYVRNAINAVTKRYGYRIINAVSHSMGNLEYYTQPGGNHDAPTMSRIINHYGKELFK